MSNIPSEPVGYKSKELDLEVCNILDVFPKATNYFSAQESSEKISLTPTWKLLVTGFSNIEAMRI